MLQMKNIIFMPIDLAITKRLIIEPARKTIIFLVILLMWQEGKAQFSSTDPRRQVTPQSPEASAFNRYIDIPVSLHTGVPEVSIPIYNIKLKSLDIPINLNYHASGVRVDELAPNTGLGWSLSPVGNISQSINGLNDLDAFGWVNMSTSELTPQTGLIKSFFGQGTAPYFEYDSRYFFNKRASEGLFLDTQPDIFYFSMPNRSGKFFFDQQKGVHLVPHQNIKVVPSSYTNGNPNFILTDERGFVYIYDQIEMTSSIVQNNCTGTYWPLGSRTVVLTKIITPTCDTVTYVYSDKNYSYKAQVSETRTVRVQGSNDCPNNIHCVDKSIINIKSKQLSEIIVSDGLRIVFGYATNDRLDVVGNPALQQITVYSGTKQLQQHRLNYTYFTSPEASNDDPSLKYRLRLDQVIKNGIEIYSLQYDQTAMPLRLSFAQDHYGFYNGATTNTTLLPINIGKGFTTGADREVNPDFSKAGSLTKINYPMGGYTRFEMESNTYPYHGNSSTVQIASHRLMPSSESPSTYSFTVPESGRDFKARWKITAYQGSVTLSGPSGFTPVGFTGSSNGEQSILHLSPGTYKITFSYLLDPFNPSDDYFRVSWIYNQQNLIVENRPTGGLRVKKIEFNGGIGTIPFSNNYVYASEFSPTLSSGRLMYMPQNEYDSWMYSSSEDQLQNECRYLTQVNSSVAPLGTILGGNVVYDHLNVYKTSSSENGMTSYTFLNEGMPTREYLDPHLTGIKFPFAPQVPNDCLNGLLKTTRNYRYDTEQRKMILLNRNDKEYKINIGEGPNEFSVRGVKIGVLIPSRCLATTCSPIQFAVDYYFLNSTWSYLTKETDSTFNVNSAPLVVTTLYHYDNPSHLQITRKQLSTSTEHERYSFMSYPHDYLAGTVFIDDLKAKNNLIANIEKVEYIVKGSSATITNGEITEYKEGGRGDVDKVYRLNSVGSTWANLFKFSTKPLGILPNTPDKYGYQRDERYKEKISFGPYDEKANVRSVSIKDGVTSVYLWSYNGKYPIAEIKNANYAVVESLLGGSLAIKQIRERTPTQGELTAVFGLLRNSTALNQSLITTYAYDSHIGMTSMTDAKGMTVYYEYDSFGRLRLEKDHLNKVVKSYDYHYKQP